MENSPENLKPIIHEALDAWADGFLVPVYNGSEKLVEKPLRTALTSISEDVRDVRNKLLTNTEQTTENTKLLKGARNRRLLWNDVKAFSQHLNDGYRVKVIYKIGFTLIAIYVAWHGAHDLTSFFSTLFKSLTE